MSRTCIVFGSLLAVALAQPDACMKKCTTQGSEGCCHYVGQTDGCQWCPQGHVDGASHVQGDAASNCNSGSHCDGWNWGQSCQGSCAPISPTPTPSPAPKPTPSPSPTPPPAPPPTSDVWNAGFCGVVSSEEEFVNEEGAITMKSNGVDWFWNYDTDTKGFLPSGWKFLGMQWGISMSKVPAHVPNNTKWVMNYHDYHSNEDPHAYSAHWASILSPAEYEAMYSYPKHDYSTTVFHGWNEPDTVGVCNVNKKDDWCKFSEGPKGCPKFQNSDHDANSYDPTYWGYDQYWCCDQASGQGWWMPEITNIWRSDPGHDKDRFSKQWLEVWKYFARGVKKSGFRLGSPAIATHTDTWLKWFVDNTCPGESCPDVLVIHHYDQGCNGLVGPALNKKLDDTVSLIKNNPTIKGMLITELGLLTPDLQDRHDQCDKTGDYLKNLFQLFKNPKYRKYILGVSWFSVDGTGGVYDLRLFNDDGSINNIGQAYMDECKQMMTTQVKQESETIVV